MKLLNDWRTAPTMVELRTLHVNASFIQAVKLRDNRIRRDFLVLLLLRHLSQVAYLVFRTLDSCDCLDQLVEVSTEITVSFRRLAFALNLKLKTK